jgi:transcriptional regulator with XRE-family HTH domain
LRSDNRAAAAFADRLRELMNALGYTSRSSRSGVDVRALARASGTTYEMARRYAEGVAIPRPDKLEAIAKWLGVEPGALAWGNEQTSINSQVLEECLKAISEAQARTGRHLSTEKAARLVALLYQEAIDGKIAPPGTVDLLVKT